MFFPKLQLTIAAIVACCAIQSSSAQDQTVVDIAVGNPDFSTLVAAVTAADLVETLSGEGPFTVLAPTNEAFDNLPEGTLDALLADIPALTEILMLHVISGTVLAEDVTSGPVETLGGEVEAVVSADGVVSFNGASVTTADIMASNGVIHVLDSVILPASAETEPTMTVDPVCQSIVEIGAGNPDFSTLVAAVTAADLVETLSGDGPFTVLAPTNEAFDNLPEGTLDALLADIPALTEILMLHVISGTVLAEDVTSGPVETLGGEVEAVVSADGVTIGDAGVTATDIMACNGVIHVLDSVIVAPSSAPTPVPTEMPESSATAYGTGMAAAAISVGFTMLI
jgi:transforming growth factor-beta-induced protein